MPLFPIMLAAIVIAATAAGTEHPVTYLRCQFETSEVYITADEANSSVTVSLPSTGFVRRAPAAFTAADVRFSLGGVFYEISRTDLTVVRSVPVIKRVDKTKCILETPKPRAF